MKNIEVGDKFTLPSHPASRFSSNKNPVKDFCYGDLDGFCSL
jgi:hypothetical protein